MSSTVRSELNTLGGPIADLLGRHQVERARSALLVPGVGAAGEARHDEHRGTKAVPFQNRKRKRSRVGIRIVEGEQNRLFRQAFSLAAPAKPIRRADTTIASLV